MGQYYRLEESNWKDEKSSNHQIAILPWGATEAHNFHLPYGTDTYLANHIASAVAEKLRSNDVSAVVLPAIPYGVNTGQMDVKLCMNLYPSTQLAILRDICEVLSNHGIPKLVILNAHGGNHFKQMIRELSVPFPELFICAVDWWKVKDGKKYFHEPGDHAGELETSAMMYIKPDLCLSLTEAGAGEEKKFILPELNSSWVSTQRQWTRVTKDTGVGNPEKSTKEKGKLFIEDVCESLADFLIRLSGTPNSGLYEI